MTPLFFAGLGAGAFIATCIMMILLFACTRQSTRSVSRAEKMHEDTIKELQERNRIDRVEEVE